MDDEPRLEVQEQECRICSWAAVAPFPPMFAFYMRFLRISSLVDNVVLVQSDPTFLDDMRNG